MRLKWSVLMLLHLSAPALASDLSNRLAQARTEMDSDSYRTAKKTLVAAQKSLPLSADSVTNAELASLYFHLGVLERLRGDTRGRTMAAWRRALIVKPDFEWDSRYLGEGDDWSLFEALRSEVNSYPMVDISVPEQQGAAILYVDGKVVRSGDSVIQGIHLAQVRCDDGIVRGSWTEFQGPFDWFDLCPGGVDISVVLTESSGNDDEWSEFGPVFGSPVNSESGMEAATDSLEPAVEEPLNDLEAVDTTGGMGVEPTAVLPSVESETESIVNVQPETSEPIDVPIVEDAIVVDKPDDVRPEEDGLGVLTGFRDGGGWLEALPMESKQILSSGGALLVTGMVVNFTVVNSTWAEIDAARKAPESVSRDDADALTTRFNRGRTAVFVLGGSGMAMLGLGAAAWLNEQGTFQIGNVIVQPEVNPTRVGIRVDF